jgi:hypothetical protein
VAETTVTQTAVKQFTASKLIKYKQLKIAKAKCKNKYRAEATKNCEEMFQCWRLHVD